jgi:hypothetical protein
VFDVDRDVPASPYEFDWFDKTACHGTINNRGSVADLEKTVADLMSAHLGDHSLQWALSTR